MRHFFTVLLLLFISNAHAQVEPNATNLTNLIALGKLYNPAATGTAYIKRIDSLRTPTLNNMVNAFTAIAKHDTCLLTALFLARPTNTEMQWWYAFTQIYHKPTGKAINTTPNLTIAKNALAQTVDERCLLANYYAIIDTGIALSFKDKNLSNHNFNLDNLGLKDSTEKAIFFLSMVNNLAAAKVGALISITNAANKFEMYETILTWCNNLPKFNGRAYYLYLGVNYPNFSCNFNNAGISFSKKNMAGLYNILIGHYLALLNIKRLKPSRAFYFTSLLNNAQYFHFATQQHDLELLYKHMRGAMVKNLR